MLQALKAFVRDHWGVPPWLALAAAGCVAYLALNALLRRPMLSPWGLIAPLCAGVALESYEIWVQYHDAGLFAAGNDPLLEILGRHATDVLIMLSGPLTLVMIGLWTARTAPP